MYRFENISPKIKAENGYFEYLITSKTKEYILKNYLKSKCLDCTIKKLRKKNKIDKRISESAFKRRMQEYEPYQRVKKQERIDLKNLKKKIIQLKSEGLTYSQISEKTEQKYSVVWGIINKDLKAKKHDLKRVSLTVVRKSEKIVNDWNKNNYKNRIPSLETLKAFDFLGLEIERL